MKKIFAIISVLLCMTILVQSVPVYGLSEIIASDEAEHIVDTPAAETLTKDTESIPYILGEITAERTQTEKHYKLSDGSYLAVKYNEPVHFLSEEGIWEDIDNTLTFEGKADSTDLPGYTNASGVFSTKFANSANSNILFKISDTDNENVVSFELAEDDINSIRGVVSNEVTLSEPLIDSTLLERNKELLFLDNLTSQIDYTNIFEDVDFQYIVTATGVKENIIINAAQDSYSFSFIVNTGDLSAVKNADGSISIGSAEKTEYIIPAPFMYDDDGDFSDSVYYTLCYLSYGKYRLEIAADSDWINEEDRTFPVTIDPVISTVSDDYCEIVSTRVESGTNADTNYINNPTKYVGVSSNGSVSRTYVNWNELPYLKAYDKVISAELYFHQAYSETTPIIMEAHKVTEEWDASTVTWNTRPDHDSKIIDYTPTKGGSVGYVSWDITDVAQEWYETGSSNGIVLVSSDESSAGRTYLLQTTSNPDIEPYVLIQYRCQNGLEDHYTHTTFEVGSSGVAYINNYTGTLTYVHDLFDSETSTMPIDLDLIYSSGIAYRFYSGRQHINTCFYDNMDLTEGWKLSAQESIVPIEVIETELVETECDYAYIYSDSDGTEHYFYLDTENTETTQYIDEDGLGMVLVCDGVQNQYTITFAGGRTKTFKIINEERSTGECFANGYIISDSDGSGNTITYTYDTVYPTRLISITDASGYTVALGYNDSGYFNKVTAGDRVITLGFEYGLDWRISSYASINDNYGDTVYFTFGGAMKTITTADGSVVSFTYEPASYFDYCYRVRTASWKTGAEAALNTAEFTYDRSHATTVHYYGTDCLSCTAADSTDDIYITYAFDKYGNTTLVYAEDSLRETVYSTSMYGYASGNTMNMGATNFNLTSYANTGMISDDLLIGRKNESGSTSFVRVDEATVTVTDTERYVGEKAHKCVVEDTNESVDGISTITYLEPNEYCFSVYVKIENGFEGDVKLYVRDQSLREIVAVSEGLSSTVSSINGGWQRLSVDFDVEVASSFVLSVFAENGSGTFYADGYQLEEKTAFSPSAYNMIDNFGFESTTQRIDSDSNIIYTTDCWEFLNSESTTNANDVKFGDRAVKIIGDISSVASVSQTIPIGSLPENSYILSGWAQADSVPVEMQSAEPSEDEENTSEESESTQNNATFGLFADVAYTWADTNGVYHQKTVKTVIPFTWETDEWQYVSGVVELPESTDGETIVSIDSITVGASYDYNCNTAIFDNIALVQDSALRIYYDENGNISAVTENNEETYECIYDDDGNLTQILDENKSVVESYIYNEDGNLISVKDKNGVEIETYTYDENGNLETSLTEEGSSRYSYTPWGETKSSSTTVMIGDVQKTMSYESVYDSVNRLVLNETDSLGNTTSYGYNADRWLNFVEDANGNQTRYNYTSGKLMGEYADLDKDGALDEGEASLAYSYDTYGRLSGVTTATTEYVFTYNSANLLHSVSIAGEDTPLITYQYNETYNVNTGVTYANGLTIEYVYDIMGNVESVKRNGETALEYRYNGNMQVIRETDHVNGAVTEYHYTDGGELYLTKKVQNGIEILEYYDASAENTSKSITVINGYELDYASIYDEETETSKYVLPTDAEITSDTDKFGRTEKVYLKDSEGQNILTVTYAYVDKTVGDELRTSDRISSITYSTNKTYTYTYDAVGNITSVSDGPYVTSYEYDGLYQLTRENNQRAGKTWAYTYDKSGNILSKAEYAYTPNGVSLGTALDTITYAYANEDWGDQLTAYDGTAITYDAQGNPLNWRDGMGFSWSGRRLDSITQNGETVSFTYDANGMRTEKTVGTETFSYVWQDGRLVAEFYGDSDVLPEGSIYNPLDTQYYIYDETGSPIAWSYRNQYYYYIKNQQGDILGFTDDEGNLIATYEYDAWGKLLHTETYDEYGANLAEFNSLRYRGYQYDFETGLYYLQSRYYDPETGRFLNADDTDYLGVSGTVLSYNLYAYCENNAINKNDFSGNALYRLVAIGLQIELNVGMYTAGFEFIFTKNNNRIKAYLFQYKGGSIGAGIINSILDIAKKITKNIKGLFSMSLSLCFMAIFSKKNFNADTYEGPTDTAYVVTWGSILGLNINTKTFFSAFGAYRSAGVGFTNSKLDIGYSRVHYNNVTGFLTTIGKEISNIYNTIYNKVKKLKP